MSIFYFSLSLDNWSLDSFLAYYEVGNKYCVTVTTSGNLGLASYKEEIDQQGFLKRTVNASSNFLFTSPFEVSHFLDALLEKAEDIESGRIFHYELKRSKYYYLILDRIKGQGERRAFVCVTIYYYY